MDSSTSPLSTGARPLITPIGADHFVLAGVSWSAVLGGAVVIDAISFILLSLGAGLGLSTITPWSGPGDSPDPIGMATILWLVAMQAMSGGLGGYLAGRFRNRWVGIHGDETYFRDTAHGFLAWGVALIGTVAFLASAATVMAGGAASAPSNTTEAVSPNAYYVDVLLRSPTPADATPETRGELERILARTLTMGTLAADDRTAAGRLITQHTGVDLASAERRTTDVVAMATSAAEEAKDALGHSLLWVFLGLLVGAFCASAAATIGGRQRDQVRAA